MLISTLLACAAISAPALIEAPSPDDTSVSHPQADYIRCLDCGAKVNLNGHLMKRLEEELEHKEDFTIEGLSLQAYGYCRACTQRRLERPQEDLSLPALCRHKARDLRQSHRSQRPRSSSCSSPIPRR